MSDTIPTPEGAATEAVADDVPTPRSRRLLKEALRRPSLVLSFLAVLLIVLLAIFSRFFAPYDPNALDLSAVFQGPGPEHLLGTDQTGRDQLSRLIFGAQTSLVAAVQAVAISLVLGVPTGLAAGYRGGAIDAIASRVNDALMSVPNLILALAMIAVLGRGLTNAMVAIGIIFAPRVFRVVRAAAISLKTQVFVEVLESVGASRLRIMLVHILPHTLSPLLVVISISLGNAVIAETSLSFLGLGVQPPTASWGDMLASAQNRLDLVYLMIPPGMAILFTVAAFTFLGDALRDLLGTRRESRGV